MILANITKQSETFKENRFHMFFPEHCIWVNNVRKIMSFIFLHK